MNDWKTEREALLLEKAALEATKVAHEAAEKQWIKDRDEKDGRIRTLEVGR